MRYIVEAINLYAMREVVEMGNTIAIKKTDITDLEADIIVNAANEKMSAGGGVCGAIFKAAGFLKLTAACKKIGRCTTGSAVMTPGFKLKAKYIVHAVGPVWKGGYQNEAQYLYSAYQSSLELAMANDCHSIAFPLISAGIYGYPQWQAWQVAVQACLDFFRKNPQADLVVVFAVLDDEILEMGKQLLRDLASQIPSGA